MRGRDAITVLRKVKRVSRGWTACCPAHDDENPSLSIAEGPDRDLFYCHAGCRFEQIRSAIEALLPSIANEQAQVTQRMQEGDRMDNVAVQNGQSPSNYRQIAEQNNIDNPQRVPSGTPLRVTG